MDITEIIKAAALLLILGAFFGTLIVVISKKLSVEHDVKIDKIKELLTGANCGACGFAGCEAYAKALYEGRAKISDCPSTPEANKKKINEIRGIAEETGEKTYAIVHCCGGNACRDKYEYQGYGDCRTAEMLGGGRKACYTGCIGLATCVDKCPNFAIEVNENGYSQVKRENCTSCGLCITNCPKGIIERIRASAKVYCACSNHNKGKDVKDVCPNGCIACGLCAKICPSGAITMVDNLPVFDYDKCTACMLCVQKCPTKVIKEIK
jgi:Na+-translocating ferredoxin:NAD+ oxidoreductase RNF subunit RnfB